MAHARMVDAYVRQLLGELFDGAFQATGDGYRVPLAGGPLVEVLDGPGYLLRVRVTAPLAHDVACAPAMLVAVNHVNTQLPYGRVLVDQGQVLAEHTVLGGTLDRAGLDNAVKLVGWVVENFGNYLANAGGGVPAEGTTPDGRAGTPTQQGVPDLDVADAATVDPGPNQLALQVAAPVTAGNAAGYL